ncbi:MAG: hypothetical protein CME71_03130 [Halobacteriovorax sp.]|nr:hypothetical protein [Halobacteriovorax sp.]
MSFKTACLILLVSFAFEAKGNMQAAWDTLVKARGNTQAYPYIVQQMVSHGLYFASIPYIKEYLATQTKVQDDKIDDLIDEVVTRVGVRQFEVMPTSFLSRSNAPMLRYIVAKKAFRKGSYNSVQKALSQKINDTHTVKPYALHLEAASLALQGKNASALESYKECVKISNAQSSRTKEVNRLRQLEINRDNCIVGIARTLFADKKFEAANLAYLDLDKRSHVWPEILFEEAWNSFYMGDYNRTLGKLVTYKAPILDFAFNPENEILKTLTYMELCLWGDANSTVEEFYQTYEKDTASIVKTLRSYGKDYKKFYMLAKSSLENESTGNKLLDRLLAGLARDPAYRELYDSFQDGRSELEAVNQLSNDRQKRVLIDNLKDSMLTQRNLVGAYVRTNLFNKLRAIRKSFEGMSYIRLEILSRRKDELYSTESKSAERGRGDIQYLKRNEKQYFWTFNGEFWADELGDYVFALRSECR